MESARTRQTGRNAKISRLWRELARRQLQRRSRLRASWLLKMNLPSTVHVQRKARNDRQLPKLRLDLVKERGLAQHHDAPPSSPSWWIADDVRIEWHDSGDAGKRD